MLVMYKKELKVLGDCNVITALLFKAFFTLDLSMRCSIQWYLRRKFVREVRRLLNRLMFTCHFRPGLILRTTYSQLENLYEMKVIGFQSGMG